MRVGFWTWVKDWVSIADLMQVQRLALIGSRQKSFLKRVAYLWRIVTILTDRRTIFSIFYYRKIIAAFNYNASPNADIADIEAIEAKLNSVASDIGSRVNKFPHEVLTGMAFQEVDLFYRNLLARHLEQALSNLSAYHAPESYSKSVTEQLRKVRAEIERQSKPVLNSPERGHEVFEPVKIRAMFERFA